MVNNLSFAAEFDCEAKKGSSTRDVSMVVPVCGFSQYFIEEFECCICNYKNIDGEDDYSQVNVPYEAVKKLCEQSRRTGEIISLKKDNWENLIRQYQEKTGPFAPQP